MRLSLKCNTSTGKVAYINTAIFHLKNGGTITIDRQETEVGYIDGKQESYWRGCYIWAINDENIFGENYFFEYSAEDLFRLLKDSTLELDLEDDQPEVVVSDVIWCLTDDNVNYALEGVGYDPDENTAEWIDDIIETDLGGLPVQVCSKCKTFFPLAYTGGGHKFCPNCGRKMKLEETA